MIHNNKYTHPYSKPRDMRQTEQVTTTQEYTVEIRDSALPPQIGPPKKVSLSK